MTPSVVCYSPTGSTKRICLSIAAPFPTAPRLFDLTDRGAEQGLPPFGPEDFVILGVPSFGGRVPAAAVERFSALSAENTPAALVVVYGGRAMEDTLVELRAIAQKQGLLPVAAGLFIARHSMAPRYAAGRPDARDLEEIARFGRLLGALRPPYGSPTLPGNAEHYREYHPLAIHLQTDRRCTRCGLCAQHCPVGAIPQERPDTTSPDKCVGCMRCVSLCPNHARTIPPEIQNFLENRLASLYTAGRKEPEFFFPK